MEVHHRHRTKDSKQNPTGKKKVLNIEFTFDSPLVTTITIIEENYGQDKMQCKRTYSQEVASKHSRLDDILVEMLMKINLGI